MFGGSIDQELKRAPSWMNYEGRLPVVSGVSDGSLAAQTIALLHVEGMVSVRVVPRLQQLPGQIVLLIEGAQQLPLLLSSWQLGHLQKDEEGSEADGQSNIWTNI